MTKERRAFNISGWGALSLTFGIWALGGLLIAGSAGSGAAQASGGGLVLGFVVVLAGFVMLGGLFINQPNHARALTLFGRYVGTVRENGFRWANPFTLPTQPGSDISLRVQTLDSDVLKVNDAVGNPVEIAAVITWMVNETGRAKFDVEDYESFVAIQTETAIRHVASEYPYDSYEEGGASLRANADDVAETLQHELQDRLQIAGVNVVDCRLRRLAYAPEIAGEMLRRQQASAVVAARQLIVDGAVGMVRHALQALADQQIVELDEERKAAMVSNLLVVLTSDRGVQPIVNAGSIYG
jgi:regulator of protease activity HflC (stomatin/prohibitin superfamily)